MQKFLTIGAAIVGVLCVMLAFVYWTTPANALPPYFPGFDPNLTTVHVKHGIAVFLLGLAVFAYAWFKSGKKSS